MFIDIMQQQNYASNKLKPKTIMIQSKVISLTPSKLLSKRHHHHDDSSSDTSSDTISDISSDTTSDDTNHHQRHHRHRKSKGAIRLTAKEMLKLYRLNNPRICYQNMTPECTRQCKD